MRAANNTFLLERITRHGDRMRISYRYSEESFIKSGVSRVPARKGRKLTGDEDESSIYECAALCRRYRTRVRERCNEALECVEFYGLFYARSLTPVEKPARKRRFPLFQYTIRRRREEIDVKVNVERKPVSSSKTVRSLKILRTSVLLEVRLLLRFYDACICFCYTRFRCLRKRGRELEREKGRE